MAKRQAAPKVELNPRDQSISDLHLLRAEIQEHIIRAGIQESEFNVPIRQIDKMTNDEIESLLTWHRGFYSGPWTDVQKIWALREPSFWANLALLGQHKLREQKLLRAALKKLRIAWRKRHGDPTEEEAAPVENDAPQDPE